MTGVQTCALPICEHGFDLLAMVRQAALQQRFTISAVWFQDIQIAKEKSRSGDIDSVRRIGWAPVNADPLPSTPRRDLSEMVTRLDGSPLG